MFHDPVSVGTIILKNRLVMPPMHTNLSNLGHVTDDLVQYYLDRAKFSQPGLIITEHCCISEDGRASRNQLSIAEDGLIEEHRRITDAVHSSGSRIFIQLNHAGSSAEPLTEAERTSAWMIPNPRKPNLPPPRPLSTDEIISLELLFARAAVRSLSAGYDGIEIHSAHGYLLNQFYSPITNGRPDIYGPDTLENRLRFLMETVILVRKSIGMDTPLAVRLGGADYLPGGSTEEDAVSACVLLEKAGIDLLDISGGMCGYIRPGHSEAGYFSSMTEKIKAAVSVPVMLTGGVNTPEEAEQLLSERKADLIGVGRALFHDAHWRDSSPMIS